MEERVEEMNVMPVGDVLLNVGSYTSEEFASTGRFSSANNGSSTEEVTVKRRRMMHCLQEIQSLVGTEMVRDKQTVRSTLKSVADHIKDMHSKDIDGGDITSNAVVPFEDTNLSACAYKPAETRDIDTGFCDESFTVDPVCQVPGEYRLVVSCSTREIIEVSVDMVDHLGFNKEDLLGQPFTKFIHERDIPTFGNSVSALNVVEDALKERKVSFFMRVWHNRAQSWYNISRCARYSVMCSSVHLKNNADNPSSDVCNSVSCVEKNGNLEQELSDSVHSALQGTPTSIGRGYEGNMYYVINCSPLQSAYEIREKLPPRQCFSYKHSSSGMFTSIEPEAIPLLGYLPQDIVGSSMFQYYHPDDFAILYNAYKSLTTEITKTACSQPIRMRVCNGEFIVVDTELSCFIDPWSHRLDFVIGKHTIATGPKNMDVFAEVGSSKMLNELFPDFNDQYKEAQNNILQLLSQPIRDKEGKEGRCDEKRVSKYDPDSSLNNKGQSHKGTPSNLNSLHNSSDWSHWDQQEIHKVYNSLGYLQGIHRLLASQYGPEEGGVRIQIPATHTLDCTLENDLSNSDGMDCGSESGSFPHPPTQPSSSTKAMLLEDQDPQASSPFQSDDNLAQPIHTEIMVKEDAHVQKLTFENLQLHEQYQRNCYLQSLLQDSKMKLFYETLSVPKLMTNLRHRLRKRKAKASGPGSNTNEIACKVLKGNNGAAQPAPMKPDFAITCIEDAKPCGYPMHAQPSARPQPEVGASLAHAHHPMHVPNFSIVPVLPAAPLYGFSTTQFRYGIGKSQFSPPILSYVAQTKTNVQPPRLNSPVSLSVQILSKTLTKDGKTEGTAERTIFGTRQASNPDEASSTSSACIFDSSVTDNSTDEDSKNGEKLAARPFWLEDLHPSVCTEQMYNYEVDHDEDLEAFYSKFMSNTQGCELYQQVLDFELGKLEIDLDEDSDCSSLFTPLKVNEVVQQWQQKEQLPRNVEKDPYTDTDSSEFANKVLMLKRRRLRTRPRVTAPVVPRHKREQPKQEVGDNEGVEEDECEGDSVEGSETNSVRSVQSLDKSTNSDSSKGNSIKTGSTVGYQGSAEMTSSFGDVYSVDECSDYIDSNRDFCKMYDKETLMEYCVDLNNSEDPVTTVPFSLGSIEQPNFLLDQLDELVEEFSIPEMGTEESSIQPLVPETTQQFSIVNYENRHIVEQSLCQVSNVPKELAASHGDSGFQSTSTLSQDGSVYRTQSNGHLSADYYPKHFSTATLSVMSSLVEISVDESSGGSQQGLEHSASAKNATSNGMLNGGNFSGSLGSGVGMETG